MAQIEGQIILALQAYRQGHFPSLRAAARTYDVPYITLTQRYQGILSRPNSIPHNRKLTQTKETTLVQWILDLDIHGISPIQALVYEMAKLLLTEHVQGASTIQPTISRYWVYRFIKRYPELESHYNQKYNYQQAKYKDPKVIRAWFCLVQNTIAKYGI